MNMRAAWNFDKKINNRADPIKRVGWIFSWVNTKVLFMMWDTLFTL